MRGELGAEVVQVMRGELGAEFALDQEHAGEFGPRP
jgi:hypothetical protein